LRAVKRQQRIRRSAINVFEDIRRTEFIFICLGVVLFNFFVGGKMNLDLNETKRVAKDFFAIVVLAFAAMALIIGSAVAFAAGISYIVSEILFM
jgi:hypothetical protein